MGLRHKAKRQGLSDRDLFTEFKKIYNEDDSWVLHQKKTKQIENPSKLKLLGRVLVSGTLSPLIVEERSDQVIGIVGKLKLVTKLSEQPLYRALKLLTTEPHVYLDRHKYLVKLEGNKFVQLSNRETECCLHLISGKTQGEIAGTMRLSEKTIEHYINNIKSKLQCRASVRSKSELIEKVIQGDLLRWI